MEPARQHRAGSGGARRGDRLNRIVAARLPLGLACASALVNGVATFAYVSQPVLLPDLRQMLRPAVAAGLFTGAVGLLLSLLGGRRPRVALRLLAGGLAAITVGFGAASLGVHAPWSAARLLPWEALAGRPLSAALLVALGLCGLAHAAVPGRDATAAERVLAPLSLALSLLQVLAHLFDAPGLYLHGSGQLVMPVSGYCFLLHSAAVVLARSRGSALGPLALAGVGPRMARRMVAVGLPAIAALGGTALTAVADGALGAAEAVTMLVFALMLLFVAFLCREARLSYALEASRARMVRQMRARAAQRRRLIAHLQQVEADLQQSLRARDNFVSIASHELRSPLSALAMRAGHFARVLRRGDRAPERIAADAVDFVAAVTESVRRLNRLVDDMLDVARAEGGQLAMADDVVDVGTALRETYERLAPELAGAGMAVACELDDGALCRGDAQRLEQVFTNLLTNAMRYAPRSKLTLRVRRGSDEVLAEIADQGPGIAPAAQARIFARYERAGGGQVPGGLGLGLYIGRQIVQAHGGTLTLDSEPGAGATFRVALPVAPADGDQPSAPR